MKYAKLGSSDIQVSTACLGSMTWGKQNTQQDADEQIEYSLDKGINFIDTAEMYPVMPTADTYGDTERIIGNWLARNPERREKIILASKVAGPGVSYIRNGSIVTGDSVTQALDASLERLQTDYIDLYQIHWPNRVSPHFNRHWPNMIKPSTNNANEQSTGILSILHALDIAIKAGKIRHIGLSNETPWGLSEYIRLSQLHNLPRVVSMQNEFSLLHTKDWPYMLESCMMHDVAHLPWSPLAGGALSGKYSSGHVPKGSRWSFEQRNGIFRDTEHVHAAVNEYVALANQHKISSVQLALAWCARIDGVTSSIFGATSMPQLRENIEAFELEMSDELFAQIMTIYKEFPIPF